MIFDLPAEARAADIRERRQRDRSGVALSLAIHFLVVLYIVTGWTRPPLERDQTVERIVTIVRRPLTIERRPPKPRPRKHPLAHLVGEPPAQRALAAVRIPVTPALPQLPLPRSLARKPISHTRPALAFVPHGPAPPPPSQPQRVPQFSGAHLAQITRDLGAAIVADRAAGRNVLAGTASQPDYQKRYAADDNSFTEGGLGSHGMCDPIKSWEADGYNYYFVSCNVRFSDGTYDHEPVPWPVRFKPGRDPFDGTLGGDSPLALPLPGWTLPPGEPVGKGLRQYALDHGVVLPE